MKTTLFRATNMVLLVVFLASCRPTPVAVTEFHPTASLMLPLQKATQTPASPTRTAMPGPTNSPTPLPWPTFEVTGLQALQEYQMLWDNGIGAYLFDFGKGQATALTEGPGLYYENFIYWAWSPDGNQLAYQQCVVNSNHSLGPTNLWLLDLGTGGKRLLRENLTGECRLQQISWHPSGQIMLVNNQFINTRDGSLINSLPPVFVKQHAFSPDGTQLYILSDEADIGSLISIYALKVNDLGTEVDLDHQLSCVYLDNSIKRELSCTDRMPASFTAEDKEKFQWWGQIFGLAWSPRGDQIALWVETNTIDSVNEIYLVKSDGKGFRNLTRITENNPGWSLSGTPFTNAFEWSPDGSKIAFTASCPDCLPNVFVADVNSDRILELTGGDVACRSLPCTPLWTPDGKWVVFQGDYDLNISLLFVRPDRSEWIKITGDQLLGAGPRDFRPIVTGQLPDCTSGWTRLTVGGKSTVLPGDPNRVRSAPSRSAEVIGQLYPGTASLVVEGPVCADGLVFWRVENSIIPGGSGWTAEGDGKEYWLEPLK